MGRRIAIPAALLGLVIVASLSFAATRQASEPVSQEASLTPTPVSTSAPTPDISAQEPTPTPFPRPSPTPLSLQAHVAGQPARAIAAEPPTAITRAGFDCAITIGDGQIIFTVPDNVWAHDCRTLDFEDPQNAPCCGSPLGIEVRDFGPSAVIRELTTIPGIKVESADWTDFSTRGAWSVDLFITDVQNPPHRERWFIAAAGFRNSIVVRASDQRTDLSFEQTLASHEELIESLHLDFDLGDYSPARSAVGHCVGVGWVIEVPPAWFSFGACDGSETQVKLNTSDVADMALQCECFGPLWIRNPVSWASDNPNVTIVSETDALRSDGTPLRIIEAIVEGDVADRTELRAVIVDFEDGPVSVVANRIPSHVGPLHTWDDTVAAQTFIVEHLRRWSDPACATEPLAPTHRAAIDKTPLAALPGSSRTIIDVPAGAALAATGCTADVAGVTWAEVQVPIVGDGLGGRHVGWIPVAELAARDQSRCSTDPGTVDVGTWEQSAEGDFDGDGQLDTIYLRGNPLGEDTGPVRDLPLAEAMVAFADGSYARGPLGEGPPTGGSTGTGVLGSDTPFNGSLWGIDSFVEVVRPVGLDRDLAVIADPFQRGAYTSQVFLAGFFDCAPRVVGQLSWGASVGNQLAYCFAPTPFGSVIRSLHTVSSLHQTVASRIDAHLTWRNGQLIPLPEFALGSDPMCGKRHEPYADATTWAGLPGPLEGVHGLSLQWLGADSADWGEITFRTIGIDRYLVDGSQQGSSTNGWLSIVGIIEQGADGDLHFEGHINSLVSYVNDGDTCDRVGGQDFRSTQGRRYWRIRDQINCDGISSDYIDIYFD